MCVHKYARDKCMQYRFCIFITVHICKVLTRVSNKNKNKTKKRRNECDTQPDASNVGHYFPGFHSSTVASLVLALHDVSAAVNFDRLSFRKDLEDRVSRGPAAAFTAAIASATSQPELLCIAEVIKTPEMKASLSEGELAHLRELYRCGRCLVFVSSVH